jgi:hypothetical protein
MVTKYETRALQFGPAAGSVDAGRLPGRSHLDLLAEVWRCYGERSLTHVHRQQQSTIVSVGAERASREYRH